MDPVLVTIPFSHYCEKARWALQRCGVGFEEQGHMPLFHALAVRRAGGRRMVPVLLTTEGPVQESAAIAAWADARRPGTLLPAQSGVRDAALELEDQFDRQLGPATRRWSYHQLMPNKRELAALMERGSPAWERAAFRLLRPAVVALLRKGLNVTPAGAERSRAKIQDVFDRVGERLRDGRSFLVGERFTIADLAFAALAAPVLYPPEHPRMPDAAAVIQGDARRQVDAWRASAAGQFVLRLYATQR